jgi:hypothetical protein
VWKVILISRELVSDFFFLKSSSNFILKYTLKVAEETYAAMSKVLLIYSILVCKHCNLMCFDLFDLCS